jgi:hypothetical protein
MTELEEIDRDYEFRIRANVEDKLRRLVELYQAPGGKSEAQRQAREENWLCVKVGSH